MAMGYASEPMSLLPPATSTGSTPLSMLHSPAQQQPQAVATPATPQSQPYYAPPPQITTAPPSLQQPQVAYVPSAPYAASAVATQQPPATAYYAAAAAPPSYWQLMWQKRREVARLCVLSLVVLLAISFHATVLHYIKTYIEEQGSSLTEGKEMLLRLAYPVSVLLLLWHVKAFGTGK